MKNGWLKQSNLFGLWWGAIKLVAQHANIYIQFLILSFSGISAYYILSQWLLSKGVQLPFWIFALVVVVVVFSLILFEWKLGMPSMFAAWNDQWWEHSNPLKKEVKELNRKLDEIQKTIEQVKYKKF